MTIPSETGSERFLGIRVKKLPTNRIPVDTDLTTEQTAKVKRNALLLGVSITALILHYNQLCIDCTIHYEIKTGIHTVVFTYSNPTKNCFHFYNIVNSNMQNLVICAISFNGLSSFLRYPRKNPVFMRLPDSIFTGNCLNILKSSLFPAIFGFSVFYILIILKKGSMSTCS